MRQKSIIFWVCICIFSVCQILDSSYLLKHVHSLENSDLIKLIQQVELINCGTEAQNFEEYNIWVCSSELRLLTRGHKIKIFFGVHSITNTLWSSSSSSPPLSCLSFRYQLSLMSCYLSQGVIRGFLGIARVNDNGDSINCNTAFSNFIRNYDFSHVFFRIFVIMFLKSS